MRVVARRSMIDVLYCIHSVFFCESQCYDREIPLFIFFSGSSQLITSFLRNDPESPLSLSIFRV